VTAKCSTDSESYFKNEHLSVPKCSYLKYESALLFLLCATYINYFSVQGFEMFIDQSIYRIEVTGRKTMRELLKKQLKQIGKKAGPCRSPPRDFKYL